MRSALAVRITAWAAFALAPQLALAQERRDARWPEVPPEVQSLPSGDRAALLPYRCSDGPVYNSYHGAWYRTPPAVHRGFAYRPFYRYTAWRTVPTKYFCAER